MHAPQRLGELTEYPLHRRHLQLIAFRQRHTLILDALDYAYGAKDPWRRSAWLHLAWAYYILGIGEEYNNFHYAMVSAIETSDMLIIMMEDHPGDYSAVEENLREWILMCKQLYREIYGGPDLEYVEVDPTWWTN